MTIFQSPIGKSRNLLSWTHYYILTQELNQEARAWYEKETVTQEWSTRTQQRNISSQYYYRILASQHKDLVEKDDTDEDIARYSVLHDNDHLFASKYMLYMPTPEQLRAEIERQKAIYYLKAKEAKEDE